MTPQLSQALAHLATLYTSTEQDLASFNAFRRLLTNAAPQDNSLLLDSLPLTSAPSHAALSVLTSLLHHQPGPWPVFHLIRQFNHLFKLLPETFRNTAHDSNEVNDILRKASLGIKSTYSTLLDFLHPQNHQSAIVDLVRNASISHFALYNNLRTFNLPHSEPGKITVAIALHNGPLLAVACLAVATYHIAAPLDVTAGSEQFKSDVLLARASVILVARTDLQRLGLEDAWVAAAGIKVCLAEFDESSQLSVTPLHPSPSPTPPFRHTPNGPNDFALQLFTSGTSGTKKVVPLTLHTIVAGVACVVESWGLTTQDVCLNMMPLNHV